MCLGRLAPMLLILAYVLTCGVPAFAEDYEWVGDHNEISTGGPPGWAFIDHTMWLGFVYPGDVENLPGDGDPTNDDAYFGTGYIAPGLDEPYRYAVGGTVFFGDFGAVHRAGKGGPTSKQAANIVNDNLFIQSGNWAFDFDSYSFLNYVGPDSGSYALDQKIVIGQTVRHTGAAGDATLTLSNGILEQRNSNVLGLHVGDGDNIRGELIVQGNGTAADIAGGAAIGANGGEGRVEVLDGARVTVGRGGDISIGAGSTGTVVVRGAGSTFESQAPVHDDFQVGFNGQATLEVSDGGLFSVTNGNNFVGRGSDSVVHATVSGPGSIWRANWDIILAATEGPGGPSHATVEVTDQGLIDAGTALIVGDGGVGEIELNTGGMAVSRLGRIGVFEGSNGSVKVRDSGSSWTITENLSVGELGLGLLDVGAQGEVHVGRELWIGEQGTVRLTNGNGRINVGDGSIEDVPISTLRVGVGGVLAGTGTVEGNVLIDGGLVAPGFSPGELTINGNLNFGSSSSLSMEIGGLAKGIDYDHVSVDGDLSLAGTLELSFINGFLPSELDSFELFSFGGAFEASQLNIVWQDVPQGFAYLTYVDESAFGVVITQVPEPSSFVIAMIGTVGLVAAARRQKRRRLTGNC